MSLYDTIMAPATPAGESALAVIRVSGGLAAKLAAELRSGRPPPPRRVWHSDYRTADGAEIDDAVFCFFQGPRSYTGEDLLEISCHGNPLIVAKILEDLRARGCRMAEPGEFTRRAFLNGRIDLTRAEAVMDVIRARSDKALAAAQRQLRGSLAARIEALVERLLRLVAALEASIDFPEEDLPAENQSWYRTEVAAMTDEIDRLLVSRRRGELLRKGIVVVLAGEPNSGKSTLLNRLVGFERAIVSEEPGTTRDFVEETISIGGYSMRIVDTAGLRETDGAVERAGVQRALERMAEADVNVLVVDAGCPCPALPDSALSSLRRETTVIAVNKIDLPVRLWRGAPFAAARTVEMSARDGTGLDDFRSTLGTLANELAYGVADEDAAVNERHANALQGASAALKLAASLLFDGDCNELVVNRLRDVLGFLGSVVGRVDNEAVLDRLFATFCIGK